MCGIVGYVGNQSAYPYLIQGLKKLEYRGYDSAGIALHLGKNIKVIKKAGKVAALEDISDNIVGVERGLDVDKPRNLAKSVTVE